ncbi:noncanonical pyrimidine nucleotidase, YjjG family [Erysipelothrix sp. HDW6C]|uniref:YjjG family noncanonical pyrimidine nucleotidase n=1 Tax=Erysipelothrix sp. HDW6C TaxID=2714930 RepID=UPI001409B995|nr:YjjG family noncanonical pyrimidine nucleotidase [Erysipelothrix sp. HDW6C]QIK69325.1 noncanonical pyrimidine nucleotidase, YjjG family [Erysipelothrix sp. HDW6C]
MKYDTLLIDIDNTLFDFDAAQDIAFEKVLEDLGIPYSEAIKQKYLETSHSLWKGYEEGRNSKDDIWNKRFVITTEGYDVPYTGLEMDDMFRAHLAANNIYMPYAEEFLQAVADDFRLVVVTNGVSETQFLRLKNAGITDLFELVVVSSDTGYAKPHNGFFDYAFDRLDNVDLSRTLILGDSLTADMQGGINAGISTCWYNPKGVENTTTIGVDYEVHDLRDVLEIVR